MTPWSISHRMDVVLAGINLFIHLHHNFRKTRCIVNKQEYFEKNLFFWAVSLHSGLKILSKPNCQQTCGHLGFVLPCMKHRQSRLSVILKGPGIFKRIKDHCLQLPLHWLLPGESNHPGFKGRLWLLSSNKSPRWYPLLVENGFVYIENTLFSAASFVSDPS